MKVLKCIGVLILAVLVIAVIATVEWYFKMSVVWCVLPNLVMGSAAGIVAAWRMIVIIEN